MSNDFLVNLELLEDVKRYALDEYTLEELFDELNIPMELLLNEQILQAFERGLRENFILFKVDGISDDDIVEDFEITAEQCILWNVEYAKTL